MKCCAGVGLLGAGVFGHSRLSETLRPLRTSFAAATRFSGVIRLIAPFWSSAPQRFQLFFSRIQESTSSLLGAVRCTIVRLLCRVGCNRARVARSMDRGGSGWQLHAAVFGEGKVRVPGDLPGVAVRISEVTRVAAPVRGVSRL